MEANPQSGQIAVEPFVSTTMEKHVVRGVAIIDQRQYSHLVATVIGSAVIPTAIANGFFMPRHLLPRRAAGLNEPVMGEPVGGDLES